MGMYEEVGNEVQQTISNVRQIHGLIEQLMLKDKPVSKVSDTFSGGITDIKNCQNGLSKDTLKNLQEVDPETYENTIKALETAEKNGLISVDFENNKIILTEKGQEFIKKPEFQKQMYEQNSIHSEIKEVGTELKGDISDLKIFKNTNTVDLKSIKIVGTDAEKKAIAKKLTDSFSELEKSGLLKISPDFTAKLTKKGMDFMQSQTVKAAFSNVTSVVAGVVPGGQALLVLKAMSVAKNVGTATKVASNTLGGN